jgi:hypothetical protein
MKKPFCPSCGVSYDEHLGLTGTCEELQICKMLLMTAVKMIKADRKELKKYEKTKAKKAV